VTQLAAGSRLSPAERPAGRDQRGETSRQLLCCQRRLLPEELRNDRLRATVAANTRLGETGLGTSSGPAKIENSSLSGEDLAVLIAAQICF